MEIRKVFLRDYCNHCLDGKLFRSLLQERVSDDNVGEVFKTKVVDWCDTCPNEQAVIRESDIVISICPGISALFLAFETDQIDGPEFFSGIINELLSHGSEFEQRRA